MFTYNYAVQTITRVRHMAEPSMCARPDQTFHINVDARTDHNFMISRCMLCLNTMLRWTRIGTAAYCCVGIVRNETVCILLKLMWY